MRLFLAGMLIISTLFYAAELRDAKQIKYAMFVSAVGSAMSALLIESKIASSKPKKADED